MMNKTTDGRVNEQEKEGRSEKKKPKSAANKCLWQDETAGRGRDQLEEWNKTANQLK